MAPPIVIWTDHKYRLVLVAGDTPQQNQYYLEVKGQPDSMGKARWAELGGSLPWPLFTSILQSATFPPVALNPDEMP